MIHIVIRQSGSHFVGMHFEGHALFDVHGKDLVCAAISSIAIGTLNSLDIILGSDAFDYKIIRDESIDFQIKEANETSDILLEMAHIQCETVCQNYPKNIEIKKEKVK